MRIIPRIKPILPLLFFVVLILQTNLINAQARETVLHKGDIITKSIKVKKGTYSFDVRDSLLPVLVIEGDNIIVDFNGALLKGGMQEMQPNTFTGTGIIIRKGKNIVLKNA
ncbi:MAG: hypothetical protein ABI707_19320, partial [Ferruginibacter sp.]